MGLSPLLKFANVFLPQKYDFKEQTPDNIASFVNKPKPKAVNPGEPGFVGPVKPAVDPYAQYYNAPQFQTKDNKPIDKNLIKTVVDISNDKISDPKLGGALARWESSWDANSTGGTKPPGYGLYQLTPGAKGNENRWDQSKIFDPAYNANEALTMIADSLIDADKLGFTGDKRIRHALRRFNGGPNYYSDRIGWDGVRTVNEITRDYANQVMEYYNQK